MTDTLCKRVELCFDPAAELELWSWYRRTQDRAFLMSLIRAFDSRHEHFYVLCRAVPFLRGGAVATLADLYESDSQLTHLKQSMRELTRAGILAKAGPGWTLTTLGKDWMEMTMKVREEKPG